MNETGQTADAKPATDDLFDCHVISLARTPERWEAFRKQNAATGIGFHRFEAVDGAAVGFDEAVRLKIIKAGSRWDSVGRIGVAMSHRALWQKASAGKRPLIVLEDDAYVRRDIGAAFAAALARLTQPWDVILFGYNTDSLLEFNVVGDIDLSGLFSVRQPTRQQLSRFARATDPVNLFRLRHAFGPCGYAVSPQGAARLLAGCFPMDNRMLVFPATNRRFPAYSFDSMLNAVYGSVAAYVCVPPLVLPLNDKSKSTIRVRG
jgi:GR25 family glycosyltransferase involved in LPS biosynthesis